MKTALKAGGLLLLLVCVYVLLLLALPSIPGTPAHEANSQLAVRNGISHAATVMRTPEYRSLLHRAMLWDLFGALPLAAATMAVVAARRGAGLAMTSGVATGVAVINAGLMVAASWVVSRTDGSLWGQKMPGCVTLLELGVSAASTVLVCWAAYSVSRRLFADTPPAVSLELGN